MQERSAGVVDLSAYRQLRVSEKQEPEEPCSDPGGVVAELAYHLLKAIQAVKKLSH